MSSLRGKSVLSTFERMINGIDPSRIWCKRNGNGQLHIFALLNEGSKLQLERKLSDGQMVLFAVDVVMPAFDNKECFSPLTLRNHVSLYMKHVCAEDVNDIAKQVDETSMAFEKIIAAIAVELDIGLWKFIEPFLQLNDFHDRVYGVIEKTKNYEKRITRPTKLWDASEALVVYDCIKRLLELLCL